MLTQEQIQEAVSNALPDVLAGLRKEVKETALFQAKQTVQFQVGEAVTEWVKQNLIPEILAELTESKDGLVSLSDSIAAGVVHALSVSMHETITKKLESSYSRKQIFEALIG